MTPYVVNDGRMTANERARLSGHVASKVRQAMNDQGWTTYRLAKETGMSRTTLTRKLSGTVSFDVAELMIVADKMGVAFGDLVSVRRAS